MLQRYRAMTSSIMSSLRRERLPHDHGQLREPMPSSSTIDDGFLVAALRPLGCATRRVAVSAHSIRFEYAPGQADAAANRFEVGCEYRQRIAH